METVCDECQMTIETTSFKKGKSYGTCGHEITDLDDAGLIIKDYTREGKKCIACVVFCAKCKKWYEKKSLVLHNRKEESKWLGAITQAEGFVSCFKE